MFLKSLLSIVLFSFFALNSVYAKIWTVAPRPGANFTTLSGAVSSASVFAGDTILVSGAFTTYAGFTLTKRLTIIGPGYFLSENTNLQADTFSAKVSNIAFNSGSDGSVIMGLYFVGPVDINTNNITFTRNRLLITASYSDGISIAANLNDITITQCYLTLSNANAYRLIYMTTLDSNIIIKNNYLENLSTSYGAIVAPSPFTGSVSNNIIYSVSVARPGVEVHSAIFNNNIIRDGSVTLTGVTPFNNISNSTQFTASNGNQPSISMSAVFVPSGTSDGKWQLAGGSIAIGAGLSGEDCGMFGGATPYQLSGAPPIPLVYSIDGSIDGTLLYMNVKVKSNN